MYVCTGTIQKLCHVNCVYLNILNCVDCCGKMNLKLYFCFLILLAYCLCLTLARGRSGHGSGGRHHHSHSDRHSHHQEDLQHGDVYYPSLKYTREAFKQAHHHSRHHH